MKKKNNMMRTKKPTIFKLKTSKNKKKTKKTKKSIRNKITMKGGELDISIMTTPFNIPSQSYPLKNSPKDIQRYSHIMRENGFDKVSVEMLKILLDNTTHITFNRLITSIKRTIVKFEVAIKGNDFYLFIPIIGDKPIENKSNYWISKIFYLLMNKMPTGIITSFKELTDEMKDIIVCDDAIYSGKQMSETFKDFNRDLTDKHTFHILCPFMSQISIDHLDKMDQFKKNFYNDEIMLPFSEILEEEYHYIDSFGVIKNYPYYFDHRVADSSSGFPDLYELGRVCGDIPKRKCIYLNSLLENCKHEKIDIVSSKEVAKKILEKCPPIPYRPGITGDTPGITVITPEEFIAKYKF